MLTRAPAGDLHGPIYYAAGPAGDGGGDARMLLKGRRRRGRRAREDFAGY
jgi:hypothetical protein